MTSKNNFIETLKKNIEGDVRTDPINRAIYSVDASIYEVQPHAVVIPSHLQDLLITIQIAREFGISITPRGAATGITGGCLGAGIILDLSKHLNHIIEINLKENYALCEPGVIQNQLNQALIEEGLRLGPDTSTGDRATLGGMLANNAAGSHSLKYGMMADHILEVELALANGSLALFGKASTGPPHIAQKILEIRNHYRQDILQHYPKIPRIASGYNLKALIHDKEPHLAQLIAGSEGSLGVATAIKVALSPQLQSTALCLVGFQEISEAMSMIQEILSWNPVAFEMIDKTIIEAGRSSPLMRKKLHWLKESPKILFAIEFEEETQEAAAAKAHAFARLPIGHFRTPLILAKEQEELWDLRKSGLGLLLSKRSYSRAIAFIEDLSVAPENLASFMEEFTTLLKKRKKEAGIYGHAGSGCLHIRPYIDLRDPEERKTMQTLLEETTELVLKWGGTLSGEHGDGLTRSWLNPRLFGDKLAQAFAEIKEAFDPDNLMNPGKVVHGPPFLEHLRRSPTFTPATFLDFTQEGGLSLSVDLCNGNGQCRKKEKTMCPSFQATSDEYDTTRARAQTLRAIMQGDLPQQEWTGKGLYDVLDLCLQCKGCKAECPSQVDMAKIKTEFLYHYHKVHRRPLRDYLFGYVGLLNRLSSFTPTFANICFSGRFFKKIQDILGIALERNIPKITSERFSQWARRQKTIQKPSVVLLPDTFTEFHCPEVGKSAIKVLEALEHQVFIPSWLCCGRPLLSKGMLEPAKKYAEKLIASLLPYAQQNIPIIGLEPSCLFTLKDDYQGLLGYGRDDLKKVIENCMSFDAFIASQKKFPFSLLKEEFSLHGHCHQKAIEGVEMSLAILKQLGTASEIASGCCGMAGSFGYEKEHYLISMQIGELKLFPAIRKKNEKTFIVANGFSCRTQIQEGTGQRAWHLAEILAKNLDKHS